MLSYKDNEFKKFQEVFYERMSMLSKEAAKKLCYIMANEAQLFINAYPNQRTDLISGANNIVIEFLDNFEQHFLQLVDRSANKVLVESD